MQKVNQQGMLSANSKQNRSSVSSSSGKSTMTDMVQGEKAPKHGRGRPKGKPDSRKRVPKGTLSRMTAQELRAHKAMNAKVLAWQKQCELEEANRGAQQASTSDMGEVDNVAGDIVPPSGVDDSYMGYGEQGLTNGIPLDFTTSSSPFGDTSVFDQSTDIGQSPPFSQYTSYSQQENNSQHLKSGPGIGMSQSPSFSQSLDSDMDNGRSSHCRHPVGYNQFVDYNQPTNFGQPFKFGQSLDFFQSNQPTEFGVVPFHNSTSTLHVGGQFVDSGLSFFDDSASNMHINRQSDNSGSSASDDSASRTHFNFQFEDSELPPFDLGMPPMNGLDDSFFGGM
jgi:hypothetical protein